MRIRIDEATEPVLLEHRPQIRGHVAHDAHLESAPAYGTHDRGSMTRSYSARDNPGTTRSNREKRSIHTRRCASMERSRPFAISSGVLPRAHTSSHNSRARASDISTPTERANETITSGACGA